MEYLRLFENHSDYENFVSGGTMEKPNVSHCVSENDVHYNPWIDPVNLYLRHDNGVFFNSEEGAYVGVDSSGKVIIGISNDGPRDNYHVLVFGTDGGDLEDRIYGLCTNNEGLMEAYINAFGQSELTMGDDIYTGREWDEYGGTKRYINYGFNLNEKDYGGEYGSLESGGEEYNPRIYS